MASNDFSYYEYSTTYNKVAYLKLLGKIEKPDFDQIIDNDRVVLSNSDFKLYINAIVDINYSDDQGNSLIHYICDYGTVMMLIDTISKGANLECENNDGKRPIHLVCKRKRLDMFWTILGYKVNIECADNYGRRPIHYICKYGNLYMLQRIHMEGAYLVPPDNQGCRPIHLICRYGTVEMLKFMIGCGVHLEYNLDHDGDRIIHTICRYGTVDMLAAVINRVDLQATSVHLEVYERSDYMTWPIFLDVTNRKRTTPREIVELYEREAEFKELLDRALKKK